MINKYVAAARIWHRQALITGSVTAFRARRDCMALARIEKLRVAGDVNILADDRITRDLKRWRTAA